MNNIVLIGFTGCGKTSVGSLLAEKLERKFIDMDQEIEIGEAKSLEALRLEVGEEGFREVETSYLEKLLTKKNKVIAMGGGIILSEGNVSIIKRLGNVVFLHTPYEQLISQIQESSTDEAQEDVTNDPNLKALLNQREPLYFNTANIIIQTKDKGVSEVVEEIINLL